MLNSQHEKTFVFLTPIRKFSLIPNHSYNAWVITPPSVIHRCFSSICLSLITSAGVFTTGVVAPTSAHSSAGRAADGGLWRCTWACWSSWSGKPILATSCWRPTGHWPSSCLPYAPGPFSWACCWCTGHGGEHLLVSLMAAKPTGHCDGDRWREAFTRIVVLCQALPSFLRCIRGHQIANHFHYSLA